MDAPLAADRVRIFIAPGNTADLVGAGFQGSNESATGAGFVDLAVLETAPPGGQWTELKLSAEARGSADAAKNETLYRWLRFFDPTGQAARIAEIEFYHGEQKLEGRSYGTVSSGDNTHPFSLAFDGDTATYYSGTTPGGNYLGIDVSGDFIASEPTFTPPAGAVRGATNIALASSTPGAAIRYTLDGADPTPTTGTPYTAPIPLTTSSLSVSAITVAPCYFASPVARARYAVGTAPVAAKQRTYHLGNSLTDTFEAGLAQITQSAGLEHELARSTIPGAPIRWLWDHRTSTSGRPEAASDVTQFVKTFAPIDQMTVQPFSDPSLGPQGDAAVNFFKLAQQDSPDLQPWIYAQWTNSAPNGKKGGTPGYLEDPLARGLGEWPPPPTPVPNTWEDTTDAMLRYHEAFRDYVDERLPGKPVLVCPAGSGLAELKRRIDRGAIPGQTDFFASNFARGPDGGVDELHLNDSGAYMVSLVLYACLFRRDPSDGVGYKPDTLTEAQAQLYKQIAWDVASRYPHAGLTN